MLFKIQKSLLKILEKIKFKVCLRFAGNLIYLRAIFVHRGRKDFINEGEVEK